jgi:acetolactate synthase-1/2/3 large subunit
VTGIGGHAGALAYIKDRRPARLLVLGSALGEIASGWDPAMVPDKGFIHVDIDPRVPGTAYAQEPVLGVQADVGTFLDCLLGMSDRLVHRPFQAASPFPAPLPGSPAAEPGLVRPEVLLDSVQRVVVEGSDATVLVEPGSVMAWAPHRLRFGEPGRFRSVGRFGSMGQMACGVLGAAISRGSPAVCLTGDGSLLMNNEISTAAQYGLHTIWVVLNDARYASLERGMRRWKVDGAGARFPRCDFAAIARAMGADGVRVDQEEDIDDALHAALAAGGPFVVDVLVDFERTPPFEARMRSLLQQMTT